VLDAIKKNGVTDVVVVVTRYFGGVLLGKGGLVRAYSKAASAAIREGEIVERVKAVPLSIDLEYDALGKLQYLFEQSKWFIEETVYTDKVKVMIYCEVEKITEVSQKVTEALNGRCTINEGDPEYFFKNPEGKLSLK